MEVFCFRLCVKAGGFASGSLLRRVLVIFFFSCLWDVFVYPFRFFGAYDFECLRLGIFSWSNCWADLQGLLEFHFFVITSAVYVLSIFG